mmetsp:Transcript_1074/g.1468  ORF Transcript_1074/g.1468 Transcript_1074/m.1468 type:complete len:128 (+) Transcript_1074:1332-1715(+)
MSFVRCPSSVRRLSLNRTFSIGSSNRFQRHDPKFFRIRNYHSESKFNVLDGGEATGAEFQDNLKAMQQLTSKLRQTINIIKEGGGKDARDKHVAKKQTFTTRQNKSAVGSWVSFSRAVSACSLQSLR